MDLAVLHRMGSSLVEYAMPNPRLWNRKLHRWGAIVVALPFLVVLCSGLLLQLKKQLSFVQPPEKRGAATTPAISMQRMLEVSRAVSEAGVSDWGDIDRLDVRPSKGVVKLISKDSWELQIDLASGTVLQSTYRRSDMIEQLPDGSWFHEQAKLWIFLPTALIVLGLWITGMYLYLLPFRVRAQRRARPQAH